MKYKKTESQMPKINPVNFLIYCLVVFVLFLLFFVLFMVLFFVVVAAVVFFLPLE